MSDLAQLLFGISALVGTLFTGITGIIAVTRGGRKVARRAAEIATERALGAGEADDDEGELDEAAQAMFERLLERERRKGGDRS